MKVFQLQSSSTIFLQLVLTIMSNKTQQLKANLQQQTKRLIDQLKQLQENRADLTEEEYIDLKRETLEELKTFQNSLTHLLSDPNNSVLESEIEKSKRLLFEATSTSYNKEEVVDKLLSSQAKGTRDQILELEKKFHLKTISEPEFVGKKRKLIVEIEETGAKLTPQETEWLSLHHHFANNTGEEVKADIQKSQMKIAQKKLQGQQ